VWAYAPTSHVASNMRRPMPCSASHA
jgi:hypothetical protein